MKEHWKGIGKLVEECGEVMQAAGKAIAFPEGDHPDGKGPVADRLAEECADLYAALDYFVSVNGLPVAEVRLRRDIKVAKFTAWGLSGVKE